MWDSSTPSKPLHELWQVTVASVYKPYALPSDKFHSLITAPLARVYIASDPAGSIIGFALTYLIRSGSQWTPALAYQKGSLAALVVHPSHQGRGVGSALHAQALGHLTGKVRTSLEESDPPAEKSQIQLGSIFPRIFPGIPDGPEFDDAKRWFERRGWEFGPKKSIDLYQRLTPGRREDLEGLMRKATGRGFTFGAPGEKDIEALYQLQKDNFESYTVSSPGLRRDRTKLDADHSVKGWPDMFPRLVEAGRLRDIHVAWDKDGRVVGATVAALQEHGEGTCPMHEVLAWPATLGQ